MTKKEICLSNSSVAYYSGFDGLEAKCIEYGIDDYLYCVSGAWSAKKRYHKLKIQGSYDGAYIRFRGYRLFLHDFILIGG